MRSKFIGILMLLALLGGVAQGQDSWNVSLASEVISWNYLKDIACSENFLYLTAGKEGIFIIDATDAGNPSVASNCNTPGTAEELVVAGDIAYLADGENGLRLFDVSNPNSPTLAGSLELPGYARGIETHGSYVYLTGCGCGFNVIDVSDPTNPSLTANLSLPSTGSYEGDAIAISGNYAFLTYYECDCGWGGRIYSIDISDPVNPQIVDTLITGRTGLNAEISGNLLCTTDSYYGISLYDISDPSNIVLLSEFAGSYDTWDIAIRENYLYFTSQMVGLCVLDITDPANPIFVISSGGTASYLAVNADRASTVGYGGVSIWDIANLQTIPLLGSLDQSGQNKDVAFADGLAYVLTDPTGLCVFDATSAQNTSLLGICSLPTETNFIFVQGNYCFITADRESLYVVDVSDPENPFLITQFFVTDNTLGGVFVRGNAAYVCTIWDGLYIVDISNINQLRILSHLPSSGYMCHIQVEGDYGYAAVDNVGLVILNLLNPLNPQVLSTIENGEIRDVVMADQVAYFTTAFEGLFVVDVSDVLNPTQIGYLDIPGSGYDIKFSQDHLFIATGTHGMIVLDATDPANLRETGFYDFESTARGLAVSGQYSYVAAGNYFATLDHSPALGVEQQDQLIHPHTFTLFPPHPNPFNPTTTLTFTLPHPAKVALEVFDINGRVVRATSASGGSPLPAGSHELAFDGSDLPSGIYFARLTAGEYSGVQKMVLLK